MGLVEYLKKILGDEEGQKVYDKIKTDEENVIWVDSKKEAKYVEKTKLDDANGTIEHYKKELEVRDKQLETLEGGVEGDENLKKEIEKLKKENKEAAEGYEAKLREKDFNYALDRALVDAKAKNARAVKPLLNLENIKLDGDEIIGLKEQLDKVKESDSYLFEPEGEGGEGGTGTIGEGGEERNKEESLGERLAKQKTEAAKATESQNKFFE